MDVFTTALMVGGVAGGLAVVVIALLIPRKSCPECHSLLPRFRRPNSLRQAMLGGWNCVICDVRISRNGTPLSE
jgi:hypothetical protein